MSKNPNETIFIEKVVKRKRDKYDGQKITGESYHVDIRILGMRFFGVQFFGTEEQQDKLANDLLKKIRTAEVEIVK